MKRSVCRVGVVAVVATLFGGCYGAKLVKGPVNSDHAARMADSLATENSALRDQLERIERQLAEERASRLRYQADTGVALDEMEESLRIIISRLDERGQRSSTMTPPRTVPAPETARNADSTAAPGSRAGGTEDELYRAAYLDLTRGNASLAIQGFQNYLVRYPTGPHLPEVHYYLGEAYYAGERYLEAIGEFRYVVDNFGDSRLVPASYLKSGRCYEHLEEKNLAVRAYRTLVERYPGTEEARQAQEALREIEG